MCLVLMSAWFSACKKFVEIDPPGNELVQETVFNNDASAISAIANVYSTLRASGFASGGIYSISYLSGLSADEFSFYNTSDAAALGFYQNNILPTNFPLQDGLWTTPYSVIYKVNAILEGIKTSNGLTAVTKTRLEGEAKFIRAFCNFYLVNLFSDVPLVLTTDYKTNSIITRTKAEQVYGQIIEDLKAAILLLDNNYLNADNVTTGVQRDRVNKFAAIALLSRVYLYKQDWQNAEILSSLVIDNNSMYDLLPLTSVFLKNSKEAIWQLSSDAKNTDEALNFILNASTPKLSLRGDLISKFETNDQRKEKWIGKVTQGSATFYYPNKYTNVSGPLITEFSMVLRLAEQYLIRAEARINLPGKIVAGISDLNLLRQRASLPAPNNLVPWLTTLTKDEALAALEKEKFLELFSEWGHRWLDIKRWPSKIAPGDNSIHRADDILNPIKNGWKKEWKLYPIPQIQIQNDPAMANQQNPGY